MAEELINDNEEISVDSNIKPAINNILSLETLRSILNTHKPKILNSTIQSYGPANVAQAVAKLDQKELLFFFRTVDSDDSAEVFAYLPQDIKEEICKAFSNSELQELLSKMANDDMFDFVDELPSNLLKTLLKRVSKEEAAIIKRYQGFKEDSAGTIMTTEYLTVRENDTVKYAIDKIRKKGQEAETIWEIFIVDETRTLVGTLTLDKIVEANEDEKLKDIMKTDFIFVNLNTDQEVVLKAFKQYDVSVIPVTDKNKRIVGIITFDDAMDVASEEMTEDTQISSAVLPSSAPYLKTRLWLLVRNYAVWLVILLCLNTFTSMTMSYLEEPLTAIPLLTAFIPSIMGTNGNASDQTATVTVRELALGNITTKNYFKAAFKELKASFITAIILSIIAFGWTLVEIYTGMISLTSVDKTLLETVYSGNANAFYISVAGLISITYLITIVLAKLLGVSLPVLAKAVHLDPAVMSQPVISTILDILSIVVYFLLSSLIFGNIIFA